MLHVDETETDRKNDPRAVWMAAIAFLNFNVTIACVWGSFSVLLAAVEAKLGIGRELSSMAAPAVNLATAVFAPIAGFLVTRYSIRLVMLAGSVLGLAGFLLLAGSHSYTLYLVAYGLLIGPGMAAGVVLPATLVTRWFRANRGRALGIISAPLVVAVMPLITNWCLQSHGLSATYLMLAGFSAAIAIINLFIIDRPAGAAEPAAPAGAKPARAGGSGFLASARFWGLVFAYIASTTQSIVITAHMVPMARSWGISATLAATLLAIQSLIGIAGTVLFGWVADRLGAVLALMIVVFDAAVLWLLLLIHPPFIALAVIIGLIGLNGAGAVPVFGLALSQSFGRESFSKAYGIANLINVPFSVLCVPAAALVYASTGSYADAIIGVAVFLGLSSLPLLFFLRGNGSSRPDTHPAQT